MCNVVKFEVGKKYVSQYGKVVCCVAKSAFEDGALIFETEFGSSYLEKEKNARLYKEYVPPPKVHKMYLFFTEKDNWVMPEIHRTFEAAANRLRELVKMGWHCGEIQEISGTTR